MSLANASKAALSEDNPQRSEVVDYAGPGGRSLHVEAVEFADYTGAWSAYTLLRAPGLKDSKDLSSKDAVGQDAILFLSGATLVVASPATAADIPNLQPLVGSLPPAHGSTAQPPLLPQFLPARSLVPGSVRYAIGPATYSAEGGVLAANSIGWDHAAEAITAHYADKRGDETLTLLIYPTPQIAAAHLQQIEAQLPSMGPKFTTAHARREGELVMLADGTFSDELAQQMVENIHMKQIASIDKNLEVAAAGPTEVQKTASLLVNIAVLCGVLMLAAVLLGFFLGGGRAMIRVLRGKDAASEAEFLSLHLAPQNAPAKFDPGKP
jgi:hypothetical protein